MSNRTKPPAGRQLIANHHLAPDVGCWMFNEGAGMQVYDYAENKHGVFTNINPSVAWVGSPYGPALDFDGTDDYIAIPTQVNNQVPFSIAFIISFDTLAASKGILSIQSALNDTTPSLLFQQQAGGVRLYLVNAYSSVYSINTKNWYNMVITFMNPPNGTATLFVDGIKTVSVNGGNQTDSTLYLGNGYNGYFDGQLVDCLLYRRVLSDDEIRKLYNEPFCMFRSPRCFGVGLSLVSRDLQSLWDARQVATRDLQSIFDVLTRATRDLQALWDARQLVLRDLQAPWDAWEAVGKNLQAIWDVLGTLVTVSRDLQALWDARQIAARDLQPLWDARQIAARDLQSLWDARQVTSRDLQSIFDVLTRAARDLQALWDARQLTNRDLQSPWDARQLAIRDLQSLWDVLGDLGAALKIFPARDRTYTFPARDRTYTFAGGE